ncbi:hypothetical protein G9A89_021936 [Geosiphon pyriformis]|nr:hypothetical protein G9A89_021936 [Geosiphon pyriformis]
MTSQDLDEIMKPLIVNSHVKGVLATDKEGSIIKTTFDAIQTKLYAEKIAKLVKQTQNLISEVDESDSNELTFLRVRSKQYEILVAPDVTEHKYLLIVIQNPERKIDLGKDRI